MPSWLPPAGQCEADDALRGAFDAAFYLEHNPHVAQSGSDPLRHYLDIGWRQGADPAPWFSTEAYLAAYADVRDAGVNPFAHFVMHGRRECRTAGLRPLAGMKPEADAADPAQADATATVTQHLAQVVEDIAPHFDASYYLAANPDVADAGLEPTTHYATEGWREGRDPAQWFSTRYYLETYADVREQGLNPFWHYVVAGREEERLPAEPGGYKAQILKTLPPLEETEALWRAGDTEVSPVDGAALSATVAAALARRPRRLIVSLTHDNYRENVGGIQLCVAREEAAATAEGCCYLALHPWQPLPRLAPPGEAPGLLVNVLLNGEQIGLARMADLSAALADAVPGGVPRSLIVHALLGFAPEAVGQMAATLRPDDAWFWLHDNFALCPSFALQRNGVTYCGAPPPTSPACGICVYGEERLRHLPRIRELFDAVDFIVVSPSEFQRRHWLGKTDLPVRRTEVVPHLSLDWSRAEPLAGTDAEEPVKVAFCGVPSPIKGWPVFERLAARFAGSGIYQFHYFGVAEPSAPGIIRHKVSIAGANWTAMRDAMMAEGIDLFLHWAPWPETFSFTTNEAIAAGAAVITGKGTGNVAAVVRETGRGTVLDDVDALVALFESGAARSLAESNRRTGRRGASLVFSRMTIDLIGGERTDGDALLHELHI